MPGLMRADAFKRTNVPHQEAPAPNLANSDTNEIFIKILIQTRLAVEPSVSQNISLNRPWTWPGFDSKK
jgi:hypothetical protein